MTLPTPSLQPPPKPYPGFVQSLLVVFLFFLFVTLTTIPAVVLHAFKLQRWAAWVLLLGQLGGVALTLKVCLALGQKPWSVAFPHRVVPLGIWPLTVLTTLGLILVITGVDAGLAHLLPPPAWFRQMFTDMGWPSVVLGAPLTEEPLFRGLILGGFVLRYGTRKAILYSALLFGLIHLNPWQFPTGLLAGLFLAWLTLRTGSLWPAVVAHTLNNLAFTAGKAYNLPYLSDERFLPLGLWCVGLALAGLGLAGLDRMTRTEAPADTPQTATP